MMASIATGPIAERTSLDTYLFFTFLNSALIFPTIMAWCWEDGWLQNLGFKDYGGAGIVHMTAGIAGFVGAILTGPRLCRFGKEKSIEYFLDEANFISENKRKNKHNDDSLSEEDFNNKSNEHYKTKITKIKRNNSMDLSKI